MNANPTYQELGARFRAEHEADLTKLLAANVDPHDAWEKLIAELSTETVVTDRTLNDYSLNSNTTKKELSL